jgi:hypothetical protein
MRRAWVLLVVLLGMVVAAVPAGASSPARGVMAPASPADVSAAASGCVNASACLPGGLAVVNWTGSAGCRWQVTVAWGDGKVDHFAFEVSASSTHQYTKSGTYTVTASGTGTALVPNLTCAPYSGSWQYEVPTPDWAGLVDSAKAQYELAKQYAPATKGYYGQVLNIVCAAARSSDPACAPMKPYPTTAWAGPFIYSVFDAYLRDPNFAVNTTKAAAINAAAETYMKCKTCGPGLVKDLLVKTGSNAGDVASLVAGADHFVNNLEPAFDDYIATLIESTPEADVTAALQALRAEHKALFEYAVKPGFDVQARRHELSNSADVDWSPTRIAKTAVPIAASLDREKSILNALTTKYGAAKAAQLAGYQLPGVPALQPDVRNWLPKVPSDFDLPDINIRKINLPSAPFNFSVQLNPTISVQGGPGVISSAQSVDIDAYWLDETSPTQPSRVGQLEIVGAGFDVYPSAPVDDQTTVHFAQPATMSLTYETTHLGGLNPRDLAVWDLRAVRPLPSTVNTTTRTVTTTITDGGSFALARSRPVAISLGNATVVEGDSGTRTLRFPVSVSAPPAGDVTVHYATAPGTATGTDYTSRTGTLTIPSGMLSSSINIPIKGDTLDEPNEAFTIQLSNPTRATLKRATATATIIDDDPSTGLRIGIGDASVVEGASGRRAVWLAVTLSAPAPAPVIVHYTTQPFSATTADYTAKSGTLTIPIGATSGAISVLVTADSTLEANEYLNLVLSQPQGAKISRSTGRLNILNDD